jgi:hypothetical protein
MSHGTERTPSADNAVNTAAGQNSGAVGQMFVSENPIASPQTSTQTQATIRSSSVTISDDQVARWRHLEECVSEFRDGRKSRAETYADMLRELSRGPELSQEEKDTTFELYSAEVESTEARARHHQALIGSRAKTNAPQPARSDEQRDESESGSEGDGDERPSKKPKLHESDMPWFNRVVDGPGSNPYIDKTIQLLRTFNKDFKKSKFFVSIHQENINFAYQCSGTGTTL